MIFLVMMVLALTMVVILIVDKTWTRFLIAGTHAGLIVVLFSYAMIWLKNGGIGDFRWYLFAMTPEMKRWLLYYPISANHLSELLLLGKSLFLGFSLTSAIYLSQPLKKQWNVCFSVWTILVSVLNYMLLHPSIYALYCRTPFFIQHQITIFNLIRCIYLFCVLLSTGSVIYRYQTIRIRWIRQRFSYIIPFMLNLQLLFALFAVFGPIQVSQFTGIYYIHSNFLYVSGGFWILLLTVSMFCICLGTQALWSYSSYVLRVESPDISIKKKLRESDASVKMLNHGMKNQLLVLRGMLKDFEEEAILTESELLKLKEIEAVGEDMMGRMEAIYHAFINKGMVLTEVEKPQKLLDEVKSRFYDSRVPIYIESIEQKPILADEHYLVEAIYNVVKNSMDSILSKGECSDEQIIIKMYLYGKNMIFEINDTGEGIPGKLQKKIFEPFYTSRNTKNNWGMGLTYAHQIVKAHFGKIHIDSTAGEGTSVLIMIPTYRI